MMSKNQILAYPAVQASLDQLQPALKEWHANQRLRLGVWAVLILLLGNVITHVWSWQDEQQANYQQMAQRLSKMQGLVGQTIWQERAVSAQALLEAQKKRIWVTQSASLARADIQAWLQQTTVMSNVIKPQIQVLPLTRSDVPGVLELHASIKGSYTPSSLASLLTMLESSQRMVVVTFLDAVNRRNQSFRLELVMYFDAPNDWVEGES